MLATALAVCLLCAAYHPTGAGRTLLDESWPDKSYTYVDNGGYIDSYSKQYASNVAKGQSDVNQANANQISQAAGNGATASNNAQVSQTNGQPPPEEQPPPEKPPPTEQPPPEKTPPPEKPPPTEQPPPEETPPPEKPPPTEQPPPEKPPPTEQPPPEKPPPTEQPPPEETPPPEKPPPTEQPPPDKPPPTEQPPPEKPPPEEQPPPQDNSGFIAAKTKQSASNKAVGSTDVNQVNGNQNAQAAGNGAVAGNSVGGGGQSNDRKLLGLQAMRA